MTIEAAKSITQTEVKQALPAVVPVSRGARISCLMGGLAENLLFSGFIVMAMPIYNIGMGVNAVWLGWAMAIPRFIDAFIGPVIGNLSDNARTRWGRRKPFLVGGAVGVGILFSLLWLPPASFSKMSLIAWFGIIATLMMISLSCFQTGFGALCLELSDDMTERTKVISIKVLGANAAGFLLPWLYKLCLLPMFGGNEVKGARIVGTALGLGCILAAVMPAFFCQERARVQAQPKLEFIKAFKITMKNLHFLILSVILVINAIGTTIVIPVGTYVGLCYVCRGDKQLASKLGGVCGTLYGALGIASSVIAARVGARYARKKVIMICLGCMATGFALTLLINNPDYPWLQLIPPFIICPPAVIFSVLITTYIIDIIDLEEWETGLRREGMFGGVMGMICKVGLGLSTVIGGYLLQLTGYLDSAIVQPDPVMWNMRLIYALFPAVSIGFTVLVMATLNITDNKMVRVRDELAHRRHDSMTEQNKKQQEIP